MHSPPHSFSWYHPALFVAKSTTGMGVFTRHQLPKNMMVALLGGYIMTLAEEQALPETIRDFAHQVHDDFVIGPNHVSQIGLTDKFSHSCTPNTGFRGQIALVTMREVFEGEELAFDYAMVLSGAPYEMKCRCGSKRCRGLVTAEDWKIPGLQEKYRGYFQPYIEEKIESMVTDVKDEPF
jgi:hypothetical protein